MCAGGTCNRLRFERLQRGSPQVRSTVRLGNTDETLFPLLKILKN